MSNPYLSIVVAARNDNYGGDFTLRLQRCVNWTCRCSEKFQLPIEFIIVNWNPIAEGKQLSELLDFPKGKKFFTVKIITVPAEIHQKFYDEKVRKKLPLYEYIAKNTGIARAKGEFILAANPDICISEEIFSSIASDKLKDDSYYKTDRIDFYNPGNFDWSDEDGEALAQQNMFRVFLKGWSYPLSFSNWKNKLNLLRKINAWRANWFLWLNQWEPYVIRFGIELYPHNVEYLCHCNASGDFMLLHRTCWQALRAYPQNRWLPLHTDSLFVAMANASGLKEVVFADVIFHQHHERRFDAALQTNDENRSEYLKFQTEAKKMLSEKKPVIYNAADWGLQNEILPEMVL